MLVDKVDGRRSARVAEPRAVAAEPDVVVVRRPCSLAAAVRLAAPQRADVTLSRVAWGRERAAPQHCRDGRCRGAQVAVVLDKHREGSLGEARRAAEELQGRGAKVRREEGVYLSLLLSLSPSLSLSCYESLTLHRELLHPPPAFPRLQQVHELEVLARHEVDAREVEGWRGGARGRPRAHHVAPAEADDALGRVPRDEEAESQVRQRRNGARGAGGDRRDGGGAERHVAVALRSGSKRLVGAPALERQPEETC